MKTVKLYYGSSMQPDWTIFETGAELPELLKFCFEMELGFATLPDDEVEKISKDFDKKYHFKLLACSEEFTGDVKATIFKSKSGKFLSCVNSKFIELVNLTGYGDCLNYGKAINRKNPICYNDGAGCGFVLLPINIDASEILNNVLNFDY